MAEKPVCGLVLSGKGGGELVSVASTGAFTSTSSSQIYWWGPLRELIELGREDAKRVLEGGV